ncbi:hypothetical protein ACFFU9_03720 [Mariniflexile ostreae]|uniref:Uncharacterized protein n=1 Tax=Mariniflexile ostreae TaxID=1520892 RepID=A0ABV5F8T1_9FLAO
MNLKWYISALMMLLTLTGMVFEPQVSVPNQEIILHFTDAKITPEQSQNTLELVKKQLQDLGAENIQVKESPNGSLNIVYYSAADVSIIKNSLSKEKTLALDYEAAPNRKTQQHDFPLDKNPITYKLDVHEIHKGHDAEWDLKGTLVTELKSKSNSIFYPKLSSYSIRTLSDTIKYSVKKTYKVYCATVITVLDLPHSIPEVRAGPIC